MLKIRARYSCSQLGGEGRYLHVAALGILLTVALCGCAAHDRKTVADALATPLADLNLVHAPIPDRLAKAQESPYAVPLNSSCAELAAEVLALDELLGPDLDAPVTPANPGLVERGGHVAAQAVQQAAQGAVPFRGWVRKLTGAERYSKQVAAAIAAGAVRRAFLKGIAATKGC